MVLPALGAADGRPNHALAKELGLSRCGGSGTLRRGCPDC